MMAPTWQTGRSITIQTKQETLDACSNLLNTGKVNRQKSRGLQIDSTCGSLIQSVKLEEINTELASVLGRK